MDKVDIEGDECWEIKGGAIDRYGRIMINGVQMVAHRASYELFYGVALGETNTVLHECDNIRCVRPDHLCKGTLSDNAIDMARKGHHPVQKLDFQKVVEIKEMIKGGKDKKEIAEKFGVAWCTVRDIECGRSWSHTNL